MLSSNTIKHKGIVKETDGNQVFVVIQQEAACDGCSAKGVCKPTSTTEKIIEATSDEDHEIGEIVNVVLKESLGYKALFLGYIIPLILLIGSLGVSTLIDLNENLSGIIAISSVAAYYAFLYFFKEKLRKEFKFVVENKTVV